MIEIIKELDVEVTKPNIFQALVAKQYDMNTRFLKVTLKDCGSRIDVPQIETAKVIINAERKDGKSKGFDGVINEDGTVTVPLHSWMLELDGTVICDISVIDIAEGNNKKLTTTSFTLLVEKAAYGGDDVTSDPQYDVIVRMLDLCSEASTVAEDALTKSHEALEISAQANSKYDACVEATQNANAVREEIEAGGYIESLKEMNNGTKFSVWIGTQAEYDALPEKLNNCLYCITDNSITSEVFERLDSLDIFTNEVAEHATNLDGRVTSVEEDVADAWNTISDLSSDLSDVRIQGMEHAETLSAIQSGGDLLYEGKIEVNYNNELSVYIPRLCKYKLLEVRYGVFASNTVSVQGAALCSLRKSGESSFSISGTGAGSPNSTSLIEYIVKMRGSFDKNDEQKGGIIKGNYTGSIAHTLGEVGSGYAKSANVVIAAIYGLL